MCCGRADSLSGPIRVLPASEVRDEYDDPCFVNRVEQPVVTDAIAIEVIEFTFQPLDVGSKVWLSSENGVYDFSNPPIQRGVVLVLAYGPPKRLRLCDRIPIRQSRTVDWLGRIEPASR